MSTEGLHAWWNGYEVVAAHSEEEARQIVRGLNIYDESDIDGEGWKQLPDDKIVLNEDGQPDGTFGDHVRDAGKPGHLWSCEP